MGQQVKAEMTMKDQMAMQRSMIQANVARWPKNRQKACNKVHAKIVQQLESLNNMEEQAAVATLILLDIQVFFCDQQEAAEKEQQDVGK